MALVAGHVMNCIFPSAVDAHFKQNSSAEHIICFTHIDHEQLDRVVDFLL